jgi:pSer/pThr/pTyr-binding forkhead associated (FHA) protein
MKALLLRSIAPPFLCRDFVLETGIWTLGRSGECDCIVNHPTVSRRHAKLTVAEIGARVSDLDSQNGTWLDDKRIRNSRVFPGQSVRLRDVAFALMPALEPPGAETGSEEDTAPCESDQFDGRLATLSTAELRVCGELARGLSDKEIASKRKLSPHTVHSHVKAIHDAVGTHSRAQLVLFLQSKLRDIERRLS